MTPMSTVNDKTVRKPPDRQRSGPGDPGNHGKKTRLYIGTSGWSYMHWSGHFYPKELKPARYLEHYMTRFGCVELNSSFYHLPKRSVTEGWVKKTPDDFMFCPKLSRFITHIKRLKECEDAVEKFFGVFEPMKDKMGPVLIQLPPGLHYERKLAKGFFDLLSSEYGQYRFAIEVRHKTWISDEFLQLLREHGIALVGADSGGRFPGHEALTADFAYLRFHGPTRLYASKYAEEGLRDHAARIRNWLDEDREVWAFFNNDFSGYAPQDAATLVELVDLPSS